MPLAAANGPASGSSSGGGGGSSSGLSAAKTSQPALVTMPSPQFAALCCQLDPPDGLLLGRSRLESLVERTDQAEASASSRQRYTVVSLIPLSKLTVTGAARAAAAAADRHAANGSGSVGGCGVIGWYRRRIGGQLRQDQQPQQVQLSAKEADIHRRLCAEFNSSDLILALVRHSTDPTTRALVTDATLLRLSGWRGAGGGRGEAAATVESLPFVVQPLARSLFPDGDVVATSEGGVGGVVDCEVVAGLRAADRQRGARLAGELVATADIGFTESLAALESMTEQLLSATTAAAAGSLGDGVRGGRAGNGATDSQEAPMSPVF